MTDQPDKDPETTRVGLAVNLCSDGCHVQLVILDNPDAKDETPAQVLPLDPGEALTLARALANAAQDAMRHPTNHRRLH